MTRLTADMRVSALRRLADAEGGFAAILAHGDDSSGDIILLLREKGGNPVAYTRQLLAGGDYGWAIFEPKNKENQELDGYLQRARARDPDLWIVELDVADSSRFVEWLKELN